MRSAVKIIIGFIIIEAILTGYFFYEQPMCEPCLPGTFCPPCISDEQVYARRAGIIIAIVTAITLIVKQFNSSKRLK